MCDNAKDHEAWIAASKAGDHKSAAAIAAGEMSAEQYAALSSVEKAEEDTGEETTTAPAEAALA